MPLTSIQIISHTSKPSESVQRLLKALSVGQTVLNYGNGVDKLTQYQFFKENKIPHPEWTEDKAVAQSWQNKGIVVIARSKVKGQSGSGVAVVQPNEELPDAKVFTQYVKKKREFRVNIFQNKIVSFREKLRQNKVGEGFIRNKENGYTTTHCKPMTGSIKARLEQLSLEARKVSQSDFIGVDIIYNEFYDKLYVLEVNSGPSIEGSSVDAYVQAITNA